MPALPTKPKSTPLRKPSNADAAQEIAWALQDLLDNLPPLDYSAPPALVAAWHAAHDALAACG